MGGDIFLRKFLGKKIVKKIIPKKVIPPDSESKKKHGNFPEIRSLAKLCNSYIHLHPIWPNGIIFHQPRFPGNKEISLPKVATFWGLNGRVMVAMKFAEILMEQFCECCALFGVISYPNSKVVNVTSIPIRGSSRLKHLEFNSDETDET